MRLRKAASRRPAQHMHLRTRIMHAVSLSFIVILAASFLFYKPVAAQTYSFSLDQEIVDVYWESDGSARIEYQLTFTNDPLTSPIDFVDIGVPNDSFDLGSVSAFIDGQPVGHIAYSEYVDPGFEVGLGSLAIQPGQTGTVRVIIGHVGSVLYEDTQSDNYASARFSPTWFGSQFVHGTTDLTVTFHLPPGVQPEEPRYHKPPSGWPAEPVSGLDSEGRIFYSWRNPSANGYTQYEFGASFPIAYVDPSAIVKPSFFESLGISEDTLFGLFCCGSVALSMVFFVWLAAYTNRRRRLDYLPPKLSVEGHGIKRGLSAVEAAVLLETPLDRVLTMILFGVIKKGAAKVIKEDPLTLQRLETKVELRDYETQFLKAMIDEPKNKRRSNLQSLMVRLVKSVQKKMKGFSSKETRDYYRAIMRKAWQQIEQAETPQVKSEKFGEALEWTMLDRDFDDRTRRTFRSGPVYLPSWWWYYRPSTAAPAPTTRTSGAPTGKGISLPTLPGADFAASMVKGVQNTASSMVSNLVGFTNGVTTKTNPPPVRTSSGSRSSSGGGGCACACACACAGCACACAGGGR